MARVQDLTEKKVAGVAGVAPALGYFVDSRGLSPYFYVSSLVNVALSETDFPPNSETMDRLWSFVWQVPPKLFDTAAVDIEGRVEFIWRNKKTSRSAHLTFSPTETTLYIRQSGSRVGSHAESATPDKLVLALGWLNRPLR